MKVSAFQSADRMYNMGTRDTLSAHSSRDDNTGCCVKVHHAHLYLKLICIIGCKIMFNLYK